MREHAQREEEDTEINMTPMLDIVFIMLIFFIVTAAFVKEAGVTVTKPETVRGDDQTRASILVAVTADDQVWINRRRVDVKAVRPVIERLHAENPRGSVVVQADERAKSGLTLQVISAARLAGVPDVAIATLKK